MGYIEIVSPHFDDAVFSCWHLLAQKDTLVLTVFAGAPAEGTSTLWDRVCGNADSQSMVQARANENEAVLKQIGVTYRDLNYLDRQYESSARDVSKIAKDILSSSSEDTEFFFPLAGSRLWRHPDHVTVREVGKLLTKKGRRVSFYADIPYMQMHMHPSEAYKQRLEGQVSRLVGAPYYTEITELSPKEQARKQKAMQAYATQYRLTNLTSLGSLTRPANLAREIVFRAA